MSSLNIYKNKGKGINFILVLCLTALTTSIISTTFSSSIATGSKKAGSLSTPYFNGVTYGWTWMSGNKTRNQYGEYGTQGDPDRANYPGARYYSDSWTDMDGNLWLFGGAGYADVNQGFMNDLWRFNITSKKWTWISGNKTTGEHGVYGTKGDPDRANYPGARYGSVSWTDMDGNLWLFGGWTGIGRLNDLWRFNITSKEWTWISGNNTIDQNGVYGTKGDPDKENYPGSRESSVSWTDKDGDLWLFGGDGYPELGSYGFMNDLWKFSITSKEWTWISGNKTRNQNGVYGTKEDPDIVNYPGSRERSVSWTDTDGDLWLFGGDGYPDSGGTGRLNDLWRFNITSKEWAWMSGDNTRNQKGVYGTKGDPDMANYPGARDDSVSWTDMDGVLWLFGGGGYDKLGGNGWLNDLWRFNITSKEWAWMSGNNTINQKGVYGMKGVSNMTNYPGARYGHVSWTDIDGNLWLFGGYGYEESVDPGMLNDLWRFELDLAEVSQSYGQIPSTDDDDGGDNGESSLNPIILFIILLGILGVGVIYYKKKHSKR